MALPHLVTAARVRCRILDIFGAARRPPVHRPHLPQGSPLSSEGLRRPEDPIPLWDVSRVVTTLGAQQAVEPDRALDVLQFARAQIVRRRPRIEARQGALADHDLPASAMLASRAAMLVVRPEAV